MSPEDAPVNSNINRDGAGSPFDLCKSSGVSDTCLTRSRLSDVRLPTQRHTAVGAI